MRAISGMIGAVPTAEAVLRVQHAMGSRRSSIWQKEQVCLIGAPAGGMEYEAGGRTLAVAFAGRLSRTAELRRTLEQLGHRIGEGSPGELAAHSFARWGTACPEHLEGAFAFALWDSGSRQLFLARDPMGIQPLFYREQNGTLLVATELKSLLAMPGVRAEVDAAGAAELLLIGPGRTPGCGVFRGISELEPGCRGVWEAGKLRLHRYWKLTDGPHAMDFEETSEAVGSLVTDAIRRQLADAPGAGAFLSGGLDSGIVCAVCSEALGEQGRTLQSFSVDYVHNDRYFVPGKFQPSADSDYMGILEEALHTRPHRVMLSAEQLEEGLEEAVLARDLPGMGDVDISLLQLSREVRRAVPAVLSGECADELFGGYPWYRDPQIRSREGFPWAQSTRQRAALMAPELAAGIDAEEYIRSRYERTVAECDILPDATELERRMKQMMNLNVRWFMQTLLERSSRMGQYRDLEILVPFCDRRLAELLYRVPWEMKDYRGCEKGLLRHAMAPWLPREILLRRKSPYPKTHDPRFRERMQARLDRLLEDRSAPVWALVRPQAAREIGRQEGDWPFYGQLMRTPQTMCYLLQLDFWMRHYGVSPVF